MVVFFGTVRERTKNAILKSYLLICIFMKENEPGVFYTDNKLTLGAFYGQTGNKPVNLSRFQTLPRGKDQTAFEGFQGHDCGPTQGWNGLQDLRKWKNQSPSVFNDNDNAVEPDQNYSGGTCQ